MIALVLALSTVTPCVWSKSSLSAWPRDSFLRVDVDPAAKLGMLAGTRDLSFVDGTQEAVEEAEHAPSSDQIKRISKLRHATVRLQAAVSENDLLRPWIKSAKEDTFVGSGFVVRNDERGPLVVTNAHVVTGAGRLTLQVPASGQTSYEARVVLLNPDMDIALVELKNDKEVSKLVDMVGFKLPVLKLFKGQAALGSEVMTMGFPLGQTTVKLTKGVLSGHEKVGPFMAFQQTGPISPGNSGGPLFLDGTEEVLGINYAAAVGENSQNNNYAIPNWHVDQMLSEYDNSLKNDASGTDANFSYSQAACRKDHTDCLYRVPQLKASAAEGSPELYEKFGCTDGIFVSKIEKDHGALYADPPIPAKSFIVSVNGMTLDKFGMAKSENYFDDPIIFTDMLFMNRDMAASEVEVCTCGVTSTHRVHVSALSTAPEAASPVPQLDEPSLYHADYEQFGDVTIQPLTLNIIKQLVAGNEKRMDLLRFAVPNVKKSMLVVTEVAKVNSRTGSLAVGDIIKSVNGKPAPDLAALRKHFLPAGTKVSLTETEKPDDADEQCSVSKGAVMWTLATTTGKEVAENWHEALTAQRKAVESGERPLTPAVKEALQLKHGLSMVEKLQQITLTPPEEEAGAVLPVEERMNVRRGGGLDWNPEKLIQAAVM